jgi:hypothetical protein
VKSGELFANQEVSFQAVERANEKLVSNAQVLADAMGLDMPDLPDVEQDSPAADSMIRGIGTGPLGKTSEEFVPGGILHAQAKFLRLLGASSVTMTLR